MAAVRQQCADSFPTVQRLRVARMLVLEGRAPSALSVQCCRVLTVTRYRKLQKANNFRFPRIVWSTSYVWLLLPRVAHKWPGRPSERSRASSVKVLLPVAALLVITSSDGVCFWLVCRPAR